MMILAAATESAHAASEVPAAPGAAVTAETWSYALVQGTVDVGIVIIAASMLMCIIRLVRGPHLADRAMAVDTLGIMLVGLVILLMMRLHTLMFIDGILVLSLLAFVGTVAMAQYIARPHVKRLRTGRHTT